MLRIRDVLLMHRTVFLPILAAYLFSGLAFADQLTIESNKSPLHSGPQTIGFFSTYRIVNKDWADGNTKFVLLHIDTNKAGVGIEVTNRPVKMKEYFNNNACKRSPFVASGGFFDRDSEEIRGLLIANREVHSEIAKWGSGGVFHYTNGIFRIDNKDSFQLSPSTEIALQGKPVLVRDRVNDMISDDYIRADRISIGITSRNNIVIFGAFSPKYQAVSTYKFAELALEAARLNKLELDTLLNLDGAAQAALSIRPRKIFLGYEKWKYVPNVICSTNIDP